MARKGKLVCAACGAPRSDEPGVAILPASSSAGASLALRIVGYSLLFSAAVFAAVSAVVDQHMLAMILAAVFGLPGWFSLHRSKKISEQDEADEEQAQLRKVDALMADNAGRITAQMTAAKLGIDSSAADALLTRVAKGGKYEVDFDEDGTVFYIDSTYSTRGARVRVGSLEDELDSETAGDGEHTKQERRGL